jgi:hypothetical protein
VVLSESLSSGVGVDALDLWIIAAGMPVHASSRFAAACLPHLPFGECLVPTQQAESYHPFDTQTTGPSRHRSSVCGMFGLRRGRENTSKAATNVDNTSPGGI